MPNITGYVVVSSDKGGPLQWHSHHGPDEFAEASESQNEVFLALSEDAPVECAVFIIPTCATLFVAD